MPYARMPVRNRLCHMSNLWTAGLTKRKEGVDRVVNDCGGADNRPVVG